MMLEYAISIARRAGELLLAGLDQRPAIELKSPYEVVTAIDRASETLVVQALAEAFPDHTIVSEEGGGVEHDSEYCWLIDPLDGTNNYAHGFPFFSVSIALIYQRQLHLGVVLDPIRNELFTAAAGQGAWCNDRRISVAHTPTLAAALVSTGFPYDYGSVQPNNREQFDRIQACCQGVRRGGSAALDLAYVAAGRLDAHWELRLKPWDSAAAALMIREAGGQLSDWRGEPWHPWSPDLIASNGLIHRELQALM
jgi:myo-inositol-1(or 4)-monophosphatase